MDTASQLESYSDDLATSVRGLSTYIRSSDEQPSLPRQSPAVGSEVHREVQRAKASILSSIAKIRASVCGPADLLKHLASQCEITACLRWLGEFQILACIPLSGSVPVKDMADLSGVPEEQLTRVIRLTATIGFLHESQPGHVCHTPLSAAFVSDPSFLDAAMFLAESVAPAALQMAEATQRTQLSYRPNGSAYNLAFNTTEPFQVARDERPRLSRQWTAYLHHAGGLHTADNVIEILTRLNCSGGESESVRMVEINAPSTATAQSLVEAYPTLHYVVQVANTATGAPCRFALNTAATTFRTADRPAPAREPLDAGLNPRITVANRAPGTRQIVTDAAVYIVHPPPVLGTPAPGTPALEAILAELQVHFGVLRANGSVMLILTDRLLPEPGSVLDPEVEAVARARDLTMLQLANEGETELLELIALVDSVRDGEGGLVVANKLRLRGEIIVALTVKYQAYADASGEMQQCRQTDVSALFESV
ncbi:6-hydroxytryprostatin B O-methyltransferase [Pleurostoma richardsiae]|uniref:6-hydroxytryprostatin B O-methyltransferase n=1 Tax=Pleurostoma richardsiae TaxID=41990 RepID=A0AA38RNM6_9PEZI|nr:6-hydroxytryprostatin B O-methyltransferase [Pleurostoma richardsiae]